MRDSEQLHGYALLRALHVCLASEMHTLTPAWVVQGPSMSGLSTVESETLSEPNMIFQNLEQKRLDYI